MIVSEVAKKILSDKNISQERAKDVILSLINSYLSSKLKDCKFIEKEFDNSLVNFILAFTGNHKLSEDEKQALKKLLDEE